MDDVGARPRPARRTARRTLRRGDRPGRRRRCDPDATDRIGRRICPRASGRNRRRRRTGSVDTGTSLRFSYGLGPDSLKAIVHPPRSPVWTMRRSDGSLVVDQALHAVTRRAVIGARACDLHALDVLERTQTGGQHADPAFVAHRAGLFLVAVDCTEPAPTCFCGTAGRGPAADTGFDLALTELDDRNTVVYLVRAGTDRGRAMIDDLRLVDAPPALITQRRPRTRRWPRPTSSASCRPTPPTWSASPTTRTGTTSPSVASRAATALLSAPRASAPTWTTWSGSTVRPRLARGCGTPASAWSTRTSATARIGPRRVARYRQWLTHKLGTWHDHFGESGCVGCGRCITWCPVGIDLTAEVESLGRPVEATA